MLQKKTVYEQISKLSKGVGYKINKKINYVFIHYESLEKNNLIPFITTSKKIKHLRVNLTKEVENFYTENSKIFMKDIE